MARTTVDIDTPILEEIKRFQKKDGRSLSRIISQLLAEALVNKKIDEDIPRTQGLNHMPLEEAKKLGAATAALTGKGGALKELADCVLSIPSINTQRIEEGLTTAGHMIYWLVKQGLSTESEGQASNRL